MPACPSRHPILTRALRKGLVLAAVLLSAAALLTRAATAAPPVQRPNIVLIMADDMGYSDLGCYGGEIRTPNLDRLAKNGLRFTQFYNTARCCPTRASLLTGLYPHQAGVGHMMDDKGYDGYRGELNRRSVTIAEALRPAGYATYMTGKWHITKATRPDGPKDNWPLQRGFDRYYGTITGAGSYYDPSALVRDNTMLSAHADPEYQPRRYYYTDALTDHASRFIREHRQSQAEKPFFMYVAYTAAHWPMHALEEDIAKYRGRYDAGYAAVRAERVARLKKLGLLHRDWTVAPTTGDWSKVENKAWEARGMEVYAAMVDRMDQGIGRIVKSLEDAGQLENTLIFYLQDNGGCAEGIGRNGSTPRAAAPTLKAMRADELQPKIHPDQTRDG
ncbi:MAG: sulfatase-like hydrolase/transferase, partial [Actinomycetota bacterium]